MTDEKFQHLKEAEKKHLRAKKRMRKTLEAMKERNRSISVVQKMKRGARHLLRETEALVDTLRSQVARHEAQLEVTADESERVDDFQEAEDALREERAESLIRQYKAASGVVSSRSGRSQRSVEEESSGANPDAGAGAVSEESADSDGPAKTIGRMRTPRSDNTDS